MKKFILSTYNGTVPNFIDHEMKNPVMINMENIYYIDSYYYKGGLLTLNEFCSVECDIFLKVNLPLKTYRGNLKLTRGNYEDFLKIAKPRFFQKYGESNEKFYAANGENFIVKNPKNWSDMIFILKNHDLVDTEFLNEMVERGERVVSGRIVDTKYDCKCCGTPGYLDYLWELGEISAKMLIAKHNYSELEKYFESLNNKN